MKLSFAIKLFVLTLCALNVFTKKTEKNDKQVLMGVPQGEHILTQAGGFYKSPEIRERLLPHNPDLRYTGEIREANTIRTHGYYYDGSEHLNALHINCDVLSTVPSDCVSKPACGWCGDKNRCIQGTSRGPLAPCLQSTYLFNKPSQDWNPLRASTINIDTRLEGTDSKLIVTSHPDFARVQMNPYNN